MAPKYTLNHLPKHIRITWTSVSFLGLPWRGPEGLAGIPLRAKGWSSGFKPWNEACGV